MKQKPPAPWFNIANPAIRTDKTVSVIGAGIAGCTVAAALHRRGFQVTVIDRHQQAGQEASGNAQGIVYPKLSARDDLLPRVNLAAIRAASHYYQPFWQAGLGRQCGVLVVPENQKARDDFLLIGQRFADQPQLVEAVHGESIEALSGRALQAQRALYFPTLGWLPPALVCQQLLALNGIPLLQADIASLQYSDSENSWQLRDREQQSVINSETVVIASAYDCKQFEQTSYLPLRKLRGQITQLPATAESRKIKTVICGEGYITPADNNDNHSCGATYNKDLFTTELRDQDHRANLQQMAATDAGLAAVLGQPDSSQLPGRANFRCTTPDYLPIAGPVPDAAAMLSDYAMLRRDAKALITTSGRYLPNLFVNCGMGSRGLSYAPLTAELLANQIAGQMSALAQGEEQYKQEQPKQQKKQQEELCQAMHPARFLIRDLKRNRI